MSHARSSQLEVAVSLHLDESWRNEPTTLRQTGRRRNVACDIDMVECSGCKSHVSARECFEAVSNPFSTARCMLVCGNCRNVLNRQIGGDC